MNDFQPARNLSPPEQSVPSGSPDKFRILSFGGIGDALLLTPSLRVLATSDPPRQISILSANPAHESVFRYNPHVKSFRVFKRITKRVYDTCVDTDYSRALPSLFYTHNASYIIAEALNLTLQDPSMELFLTPAEISEAAVQLSQCKKPCIAIHVRASASPNKNWSIDNWQKLVVRNPDLQFVQLGEQTEPLIPGAKQVMGIGLRQSFALVQQCDAFVGVDSGLAHAATALQTPAVILFGATTPAIWGHECNINLYSYRYCSPCIDLLRASPCPFSTACMNELTVESVEEALRTQLR